MKRKWLFALLCAGMLITLGGCSAAASNAAPDNTVEGLDQIGAVQVVAREEGSGTRSTFAELVDFKGSNADQSDFTVEDAIICNDASAVIDKVKSEPSAIGYISQGAWTDASDIKALTIDGKSWDTGKGYSLSRDFYLTYTGQLNDLEQDFLTYVHGAGQEIVAKSYVAIAKSSSFLSNKASGLLSITGSTSVAPLMQELAASYEKINPNAIITVKATDSTDGINAAMSGKCDFGMASRQLEDYEKELLDYESIARDNIVVIVRHDNPLTNISLEQLKSIYTGEVKNWDELNQR